MHQSPSFAQSSQPRLPVFSGSPRPLSVSDPYERCFYAVCAALKGQSGIIKAMQAIVDASKGGGEARHA